jgi:type I restriction enzyme S subunit
MLQPQPSGPYDKETEYLKAGTLPLSDVGELPTMYASPDDLRRYEVQEGDLVVAEGGDVGKTAFVPELSDRTIIQNSLHRLRSVGDTDLRFIRYTLDAIYGSGWLDVLCNKATFGHLTGEKLVSLPIPLTPPQRQMAIADYLDAETARIDALIEKKEGMVKLLEERLAVDLSATLFQRTRAITFIEDPVLGPVPEGWRRMRLRHCVYITVGVVVNPSSYFTDEGVPFIHGSYVRDGWIDTSNLKFLSPQSNDLLAKSRLRAGDVVVVRAGYPGRAAVVPPELDGSNCASILILRQGNVLRPPYLAHFLNSREGRIQVALSQYGAAQEQINVSDIVDFVAPVPPLADQDRILADLNRVVILHNQTVQSLRRQGELLAEHRRALITAGVTGNLEVPGVAA